MEKETIINHLSALEKKEIIAYLESAWDNMTDKQLRQVFGKLYKKLTFKPLNATEHLKSVKDFYTDSMQRKYYAPFNINSKNYMYIPDKTDIWFETLGGLLDSTCELIKSGETEIVLPSFELLFELINRMENGEEIVFAHELGDWMIPHKHDYIKVHQEFKKNR